MDRSIIALITGLTLVALGFWTIVSRIRRSHRGFPLAGVILKVVGAFVMLSGYSWSGDLLNETDGVSDAPPTPVRLDTDASDPAVAP